MKGVVGIRGSSGVCLQSFQSCHDIFSISFLGCFFCSTACTQKAPPLNSKAFLTFLQALALHYLSTDVTRQT